MEKSLTGVVLFFKRCLFVCLVLRLWPFLFYRECAQSVAKPEVNCAHGRIGCHTDHKRYVNRMTQTGNDRLCRAFVIPSYSMFIKVGFGFCNFAWGLKTSADPVQTLD